MLRTIVQPADVSGAALDELKNWLGISRSTEDTMLADLLQASLAMCEAFTGKVPLTQTIEERIGVRAGWHIRSATRAGWYRRSIDNTACSGRTGHAVEQ